MANLLSFVDALQKANSEAVAFYPKVALERGLETGLLSFVRENGDLAGYLYRSRPRIGADLRIWQAVVEYDVRRRHLGEALVSEYLDEARAAGAVSVTLRCRSSIDANLFWEEQGFSCVSVEPGGKKRAADINVWRIALGGDPPEAVEVSTKPNDQRAYRALRRAGFEFPSRFSREGRALAKF